MFTKLKVTQSMVDAVNKVLDEASAPIKEPTSTGMKVYGRSYGNSAKAKQDQTKSSVDDLKGPKTKELMQKDKEDYVKTKGKYDEAAKPDYLDFDKDGNKAEPMKKALGDKKKVAEELKGNQHKIDANKNNKVDAHDFAILRGKKKVKESFSVRLEEKWKSMKEKKDVVMPEALEKSPEKNQDVADKSHLKNKPGSFKSDLKNLGRFLTGKKETNEEVESLDEKNVPTSPEKWAKAKSAAKSKFAVYPSAYANGWASKKYKAMGGGWKSVKEDEEFTEVTIAGTSGWKKMPKDVKDKSGAIHTPMSRAKNLAHSAFKKVQDRTKISKQD